MTLTTHTGRQLRVTAPQHDAIAIEDIAQGLSRICRWSGQTREWFSVAQHSVLVSTHCSREHARWALLHDASEAYLGDVPRPVKALPALAGYRTLEQLWQRTIYHRFGLVGDEPSAVAEADDLVLAWEQRDLMDQADAGPARLDVPPSRLRGLRPQLAAAQFLDRFREVFQS